MAGNDEEFKPEVYHIPANFKEAGGVLGGRIEKRNAIELAVVCGPLAFLEYKIMPALHLSLQTMLIVGMITLIPLAFLCAFGIQGESLSQLLTAYFRFKRRKRMLSYRGFSEGRNNSDVGSRKDKFLENVGTYGVVKALSMLADYGQNAAIDADRFDRAGYENETEDAEKRSTRRKDRSNAKPQKAGTAYRNEHENYHRPKSRKKKKDKPVSDGWLISGATKEMLLRKLELGEDEDFY